MIVDALHLHVAGHTLFSQLKQWSCTPVLLVKAQSGIHKQL
jgi:hypothetical protein